MIKSGTSREHAPRGGTLSSGLRLVIAAIAATTLLAGSAEVTASSPRRETLTDALDQLARNAHLELLFDRRLTAGKPASAINSNAKPEQALEILLKDTGLTFRRAADGSYLILAADRTAPARQNSVSEAPVAEILVIGRVALNADIRRTVDDAQPYQVIGSATIERAQSDSLDDYLRNRLPQNGQMLAAGQAPRLNGGAGNSQVDLRGLGTAQTLILVDGRRLPSLPASGDFLQPDLNAFPLAGIDRLEVLGSTAGGIFGIGAAGGAMNLVTKSDFSGVELALRNGISDQGDAGQRMISGHVGFTSRSGHTKVSVRLSDSRDDGLAFGDRSFIEDARLLRFARAPAEQALPVSSSINIRSAGNVNLVLLPLYGGADLRSRTTFLPPGSPSIASGGVAALVANAGRLDLSLAPDAQGAQQSLLSATHRSSTVATLRQDVGSRVVVFADYLRLIDEGHAIVPALQTGNTYLAVGAAGNPFAVPVEITYPTGGLSARSDTRITTDRLTVGAIVKIGHRWTANIDAAAGAARVLDTSSAASVFSPAIDVFAGQSALDAQLSALAVQPYSRNYATNRLHDVNLRIAGPILQLPGGPLSLTATGELREERAPGETMQSFARPPLPASTTRAGFQRQDVASLFGELRAPLIDKASRLVPLRGLEFQLAVRRDRYETEVPVTSPGLLELPAYGSSVTTRAAVTSITASAHVRPTSGLMLRTSYSDGYTPPTPTQIVPTGLNVPAGLVSDPKRGGLQPFSTDEILLLFDGSPSIRAAHARTLSIGAVITPVVVPGLRLSIDYSALQTTGEVTNFANGDFAYFLAHEAQYPDRIQRAALSDADRALGYTGGKITRLDASYLTTGRSDVRSLDVTLGYTKTTNVGIFHLYGQGSWEPVLKRQSAPGSASFNSVDHINGPLALRGNAGVDWTLGPWSAGFNAQGYGSNEVTYAYAADSALAAAFAAANAQQLLEQGGQRVPAQAYVDAYAAFSSAMRSSNKPGPTVTLRLGVKNLFGTLPPTVAPALVAAFDEIGYSSYGDARGRRFDLDIVTRF